MTQPAVPGHALVTRRAIAQVVRAAALRPYGVVELPGEWPLWRHLRSLGIGTPGVEVRLVPAVAIDVYLEIARGLPIAEVARQVEATVRYAVRRTVGIEIDRLTIHVGAIPEHPAADRPLVALPREHGFSSTELAESGTDVA